MRGSSCAGCAICLRHLAITRRRWSHHANPRSRARVTIDGSQELVTENQSVYVPLGVSHRLENPGNVPMYLIEVQTGAYLGEDDISRHEDAYNRCPS